MNDENRSPIGSNRPRHKRSRNTSPQLRAVALLGRVALWTVLIATIASVTALVLVPKAVGGETYTVLTGSMRPGMPPGTAIIVKPEPFGELKIGDVITYQMVPEDPAVVTHRVVSIDGDVAGTRLLQTQGDANNTPDVTLVQEAQVRGKVWYQVPFVGDLVGLLTLDNKTQIFQVVGAVILLYGIRLVISHFRERRPRASSASHEETTDADADTRPRT